VRWNSIVDVLRPWQVLQELSSGYVLIDSQMLMKIRKLIAGEDRGDYE
jgi:hypothetical protein